MAVIKREATSHGSATAVDDRERLASGSIQHGLNVGRRGSIHDPVEADAGDRVPDLLLVGQPTRGVDIGAIEFIHKSLIAMRDAGCAVLLVSVELDEILSLSDRILVMFEGRIVGEVAGAAATEQTLGLMMANVVPEDAAVRAPA